LLQLGMQGEFRTFTPHRIVLRTCGLCCRQCVCLSACRLVCLSVCWSWRWALHKRLKRMWCHLGVDSGGPEEPCVRWGSRSAAKRQYWG